MPTRQDHTGKVFGCLTAVAMAPTRIGPTGNKRNFWLVRCVCGHEKEMQTAKLVGRHRHITCGAKTCSQRHDAPTEVHCNTCGRAYLVQRQRARKPGARRCTRCISKANVQAITGVPAHNRLPGDEGSFRNLLGRYVRNAEQRGIEFRLSKELFREITKRECHYCGVEPSQVIFAHRKGKALPYVYNGVDRLDSDCGYEDGNVVACCHACNWMKSDRPESEFLERIFAIADRARALSEAKTLSERMNSAAEFGAFVPY